MSEKCDGVSCVCGAGEACVPDYNDPMGSIESAAYQRGYDAGVAVAARASREWIANALNMLKGGET